MINILRWIEGIRLPWRIRRLAGASLGASGEDIAASWLRSRGYRVLERNLSLGDDEIDLLAHDPADRALVIVEVKTRAGSRSAPEESVGLVKQRRMARAAAKLQKMPRYRDQPIRFDVIAVTWPEDGKPDVKHIPAAFESPF